MSSTAAESSNNIYFSYNFNLKWTLNATQLSDFRKNICDAVQSDIYQFKADNNLQFYLEIPRSNYGRYAEPIIKGSKMWSFKLVYAFLSTKERAFKLKESPQLSFLPYTPSILEEKNLVVYCLVNACPVYPDATAKDDEVIFQKDQKVVEFDGKPSFTVPSDYTNQVVIDFILRGDIPTFEHYMAKKIIEESKKHMCQVLKILCTEYLMSNITPGSFKMILEFAVKNDLRLLERKCIEKITNGSIKINSS